MSRMNCILVVFVFSILSGCGGTGSEPAAMPMVKQSGVSWNKPPGDSDGHELTAGIRMGGQDKASTRQRNTVGNESGVELPDENNVTIKEPNAVKHGRRVIFDSNVDLRVDNFDGVESMVSSMVDRHGGFISNANISHQSSQRRTGSWTVRVPVANYRQLVDSIGGIGELISRKENAQDVTAEFYDLEARIKNKKLLEERIANLLEKAKSELRRMIEVEHELARVREEIERMQGKIRYLADVTGMSTVHLTIRERESKPAPVIAASATFTDRISNAWNVALTQATNAFQNLVVVIVRNVFNIVFVIASLLISWIAARVIMSRIAKRGAGPISAAQG